MPDPFSRPVVLPVSFPPRKWPRPPAVFALGFAHCFRESGLTASPQTQIRNLRLRIDEDRPRVMMLESQAARVPALCLVETQNF